jgi:hypothetical protein
MAQVEKHLPSKRPQYQKKKKERKTQFFKAVKNFTSGFCTLHEFHFKYLLESPAISPPLSGRSLRENISLTNHGYKI